MKTFRTKLKTSFAAGLCLFAFPLWAKPVAQITGLKGQIFVVSPEGKTTKVKVNDRLEDRSELLVEEGASVTMNDYYNATYHLIGGSHLKFFDKSVQLKRGKAWIQSTSSRHSLALTTANGHVDFSKSEFIASFDPLHSRSQFLVINGDVDASNVLDTNMKYTISAGSFSLIDPEVEGGIPRAPTKVGMNSLNASLAEFKQLPQAMLAKAHTPSRTIASVEEVETPVKKGKIIFISAEGKMSNRLPASVNESAHKPLRETSKSATKNLRSSSAEIRFFGFKNEKITERKPASAPSERVNSLNVKTFLTKDPEFTSSLKKETDEQPKYPEELKKLIEDLKSY